MWPVLIAIYLIILAGTSIIAITRHKEIDVPASFITVNLILTFIAEATAHYLGYNSKNNLLIYHIFSPIQLTCTLGFFFYTIKALKKKYFILSASLVILLSTLNSYYLQSPNKDFNSNFLVFEAFIIIGLSQYYLYDFLLETSLTNGIYNPSFLFVCLLMLFWSFTFIYWLAYNLMYDVVNINFWWLKYMIWSINIITYVGFSLVFLFYKRLQPARE